MLPRLKIEQTMNTSTGESSSIQVNSERMQIADFVTENCGEEDSEVGQNSERLTTPAKSQKSDIMSRRYKEKLRKATQSERNMMFHDAMLPFSSIMIQPSGPALQRACKLDYPVFTLRE